MRFVTRLAHRRVRRHPGAAALGALCVLLACLATTTAQVHAQAAGEAARAQALASQDPRIVVRGPTSRAPRRPTGLRGNSPGAAATVSLARALVAQPAVLLADEPTGQLDSETSAEIMALIRSTIAARSMTALLTTHDPVIVGYADRALELTDGHLSDASTPTAGRPRATVRRIVGGVSPETDGDS